MNHSSTTTVRSKPLISYWPILALYVLSAGLALLSIRFSAQPDYMSHVMGFVLILFGLIKLNDVEGFAKGFALYDPFAKRSPLYAHTYPFIEILLGILFITQLLILPATLLTLLVYSASLYGALRSITNKEELHCVCLGTYFKLPLSRVTVIEAVFMMGMCIWMLFMLRTMGMAM